MAFNLPGAPNLLNPTSGRTVITAVLGRVAGALWDFLFPGPVWGIFTVGTTVPAVEVNSVVAFGTRKASNVSDYKIETGSFVSYNKVETPRVASVRITKEGNSLERAAILNWLDVNVKAPTLFDVVMPELRYGNMTLIEYSIDRNATSSVGMLVVDCVFQEIRELVPVYSRNNVEGAENAPSTPAQRVNARSSSRGGDVAW